MENGAWRKFLERMLAIPRKVPDIATARRNEFAVGIFTGTSPFNLACPASVVNPVLTCGDASDVRAAFIADPFMLRVDQTWYMFFEVLNVQTHKGEIGLATSSNGMRWSYQQIVLTEPFHLSYPYVFEWKNDYFMIPETHRAHSVRLYRAEKFPTRWSYFKTLLGEGYFGDPSIFRHDNRWWLFSETNPQGKNDTLRLYYADDLTATWREHPMSPVVQRNPHIARPGGRVVVTDGKIIRYTQDCFPRYGIQVRAFEITELSTSIYREKEAPGNPILRGSNGEAWNSAGMHHVDAHQLAENEWIACVDGHRKILASASNTASPI